MAKDIPWGHYDVILTLTGIAHGQGERLCLPHGTAIQRDPNSLIVPCAFHPDLDYNTWPLIGLITDANSGLGSSELKHERGEQGHPFTGAEPPRTLFFTKQGWSVGPPRA